MTIPNSVTHIGISAFEGCTGLTSVTIPNFVTHIDNYAFRGCTGLTSVTIPNSVTYICNSAFEGCTRLWINVDNQNQWYSSLNGALYNKDESVLIAWPSAEGAISIPSSVAAIGCEAFYGCRGLTSVTIGGFVTTIGDGAFKKCTGLTDVYCQATIPPGAGDSVFEDEVLMESKLYVPAGCRAAYKAVDPWRNFWNIEEMDFSGINEIGTDNNPSQITIQNGSLMIGGNVGNEAVTVSDMQGRVVYNGHEREISGLAKGLYIVKIGNLTTKIVI